MKDYVFRKEYLYIYLSKFCYAFSNALVSIFGVVMLYKNGMGITSLLLLYGIRFGIMGLCSPLCMKIASKWGVANCTLISHVFRMLSSYLILFVTQNQMILLVLFLALPGAISNPLDNAISSKYVENSHRGKFNSLKTIMQILGQALASVVVGWSVLAQKEIGLLGIMAIFFLADYIFTCKIDYKPVHAKKNTLLAIGQYIRKCPNSLKQFYSLQTFQIIERLFLPLYVYLTLKDFVAFTTVVTISLFIQVVTVFLTGKMADRNLKKTNSIVSLCKMAISTIFLVSKNKVVVSGNKMISDNFEKIYNTSLNTIAQNEMKNSPEEQTFLSTVCQMCLCFTEVVVFLGLSMISIFLKEQVFIWIFALSIWATAMMMQMMNQMITKK